MSCRRHGARSMVWWTVRQPRNARRSDGAFRAKPAGTFNGAGCAAHRFVRRDVELGASARPVDVSGWWCQRGGQTFRAAARGGRRFVGRPGNRRERCPLLPHRNARVAVWLSTTAMFMGCPISSARTSAARSRVGHRQGSVCSSIFSCLDGTVSGNGFGGSEDAHGNLRRSGEQGLDLVVEPHQGDRSSSHV